MKKKRKIKNKLTSKMYKNKIKHKQQKRKGTVLIKISSVFSSFE